MRTITLSCLLGLPCFAQNYLVLSQGPVNEPYLLSQSDSITISVSPVQAIRVQVASLVPWITFKSDCNAAGGQSTVTGITPVTIAYCVDPTVIKSQGYYIGLIEVTAGGFVPLRVPVHLTKFPTGDLLAAPEPVVLTPSQNTATVTVTADPTSQHDPGGAPVKFNSVIGRPSPQEGAWLAFNQLDSATTARVNVTADLTKLTAQIPYTYVNTVVFTDQFGDMQASTVKFTVQPQDLVSNPTGAFGHLAIGDAGSDSWSTDFYIVNNGPQTAQYKIAFFGDNGLPISVPIGGVSKSSVSDTVAGQGLAYFEASGGPLTGAWGQITADPSIVIQAVIRRHATDHNYYQVAVPSSAGSKEFIIPFDATAFAPAHTQFHTGFGIANLEQSTASINCTARDSSGAVIPNAVTILWNPASPNTIGPLGHWANYIFPALDGNRGTIDCVSSTNVAPAAFQVLGDFAFSSLPVIAK